MPLKNEFRSWLEGEYAMEAQSAMTMLRPGLPVKVIQEAPGEHPVVFHGHLKEMHCEHAWGIEATVLLDSQYVDPNPVGVRVTTQNGPINITDEIRSRRSKKKQPITTQEGPRSMEAFTTTAILNQRNRTVDLFVEDKDGKFLTNDGTRLERATGAEMPLYGNMPLEIFESLRSAQVVR